MNFRNAIVLVTGGGSGIGELMAVGAAERGAATVVIWDIDETNAQRVADRVSDAGAESLVYRVDVRDPQAVSHAASETLASMGRLDILINNAGIVNGKEFLDLTEEEILRTYDVNVFALYRTTREFLPGMLMRDRGTIVTIASAAGLMGVAKQTDYSASKFAAGGFTESLRAELRHRGSHVRTLLVAPYYIDTGMFDGVTTKFPALLPILKPSYVATKVLDAIEKGRQRLVIPPFAQSVLMIKGLPVAVMDKVSDFFGINSTMDEFVGRR